MSLPQPTCPKRDQNQARETARRPEFHVADLRLVVGLAAAETRRCDPAPKPRGAISQPMIVGAAFLFDLGAILAAGVLTYFGALYGVEPDLALLAWGLALTAAVALVALRARWSYTIRALSDFPRQGLDLAFALALALAIWNAACVQAGAVDMAFLRQWSLDWFVWAFGAALVGRAGLSLAIRAWTKTGALARRTVIVGGGEQALETIRRLERSGKGALDILGVFDDRDRTRLPPEMTRYRLLGTFDDLEDFCRAYKVDLLIVAFPLKAEDRILHILQKLWTLPVDVRISALGGKLRLRDRAYNFIGDVPFLPAFDKPMNDWDVALKAIFDRCVAAALIVALSPLLLVIALGVRLSSRGPILFVQKRYGFNNEEFGVYKFRSMYVDQCDYGAAKLVTRGDPRVTPFGAFLRRSSLDELPQLFNVLRGDLSLVGPRPHALKGAAAGRAYEQVVDNYFARHRVKPGITGWAQVNGWRGETDTFEKIEQRVAHDLHYIEHWSLWLDVGILLKTPWVVLTGKNAF
ncbi:Undecaprenyl-phosphate glucose phosphotransferase [Rhodoblastus acidophilus]|uniref:undecaprenyl-phosphate glucose phosphotransferase n=1 Tax=Rhodoblastus acidophilus TaxID=1074 RepID=UPI002225A5C2|nr:undecaprenyl-phosphate glucose phosphotransferase [Rhodoblastus acidophilus]MCW2286404.1 Undecaprenyl-phosphate glucose phosphotransferase [Rhodoblastus acidophilus]MCW2335253.1 Undecaprenyl-phosphate glucose phosphotransferase [Rhodoblastus acidophilus]